MAVPVVILRLVLTAFGKSTLRRQESVPCRADWLGTDSETGLPWIRGGVLTVSGCSTEGDSRPTHSFDQ